MNVPNQKPGHLGLALSGGGSRAAAFHRGTLQAVHELGLIDYVERVSTVSGGSVFGAAWLAARAKNVTDDEFLKQLKDVLAKGFIWPAVLSPRLALMALPGYSRTHRIAETFDDLLLRGLRLAELPQMPLLVLNSAVLNHAQVARFSPFGISCIGVGESGERGSLPHFPLAKHIKLGFPTAASAAFPFGLPPLELKRKDMGDPRFVEGLAGLDSIHLTDGGVLENLGVQTLLRSQTFGAKHVIVSDAGTAETPWKPGGILQRLKNAAIFGLTPDTLSRLLEVMNNKQNRSMRQLVIQELNPAPASSARSVLMISVAQDWDDLLMGIPAWRLTALAQRARVRGGPGDDAPEGRRAFLERCGVNLLRARSIYEDMGGKAAREALNRVGTNFTPLSGRVLDQLACHARWQLHAVSAIFGPIPTPEASTPPPPLRAGAEVQLGVS
jgi:predicted acylesterase/phospholipase RssA